MGVPELGGVRYCTTCLAVYDADFVRCPNDGGPLEIADRDPLIGTSVNHYQIDAHIGSGAMGRVYRCHHAHLQHKLYALKILRGDLAATMAMRLRFTQEAEAASRLVHPNVVSVVDFGRTDAGLLYLVMDFVEGDNLAALIARGPIAPQRAIHLAKELCRGLTHAHDLGFVHRDFKPDNIIVVRDGEHERPRIVDFGLAIHAGPEPTTARLTIAGGAVGTPTYAAPEQMQHEDDVDHRADLFALGITMFEMLAGRTPFDGSMLEILHLNIAGERPTVASRAVHALDVPPRLERLVQRLIAPARDDRPASTRDVLEELDAIELELDNAAVGAVSLPTPTPTTSQERAQTATSAVHPTRSPGRAIAFAGGAIALVAGAAIAFYVVTSNDPDPAKEAVVAADRPRAERPVAVATAAEPPPDKRRPDAAIPDTAIPDTVAPDTVIPDKRAPDTRTSDRRPPDKRKPDKRTSKRTPLLRTTVAPGSASTPEVQPSEDRTPDSPDSRTPDSRTPDILASRAPDNPTTNGRTATAITPDTRAPPAKPAAVVTSASVSVEGLSVRGALTTAQVKRALDRELGALRACYGPAVTKAGRSPTIALRTRFTIDETQRARGVSATGGELPDISGCVERVLGNLRSEAAPDVGVVDVTLKLRFVPEGS